MAGGNRQRARIFKEVSSSTTVAIESILMTNIFDTKENRDVVFINIPNTFIQTHV